MRIHRCALAVIERRGQSVNGPYMSPMDADEEDFLKRHVKKLRSSVDANHARGRFRAGSNLEAELQRLLVSDDKEFLEIAEKHASALAVAMEGTGNAKACVLALLVEGPIGGAQVASLLKLDAEIEAAQLDPTPAGVRLRILKELLPRPGDIQKGFSWPDPRAPKSEVIVLDKVVAGSSTKYFRDAFGLDVSPKAADTEAALIEEIATLPKGLVGPAVAAAENGGDAEDVVDRIRAVAPNFVPQSTALGSDGGLGGRIRPNFSGLAKRSFEANGIELKVPLDELDRVVTRADGPRYVTTIVTDTPLTEVDPESVGGRT